MLTTSSIRCASRIAAALVSLLASACGDADQPFEPLPVDRDFTVAPVMLAAIDDAESRLVPALTVELRSPIRAALAELRSALDAGSRDRRARAASDLRALLEAAPSAAASADRAAITLLVDAAVSDGAEMYEP